MSVRGQAVCSSAWVYVVADIPSRLEVLILRKLAEKGSTATGQPQGAMQSRKQSSTKQHYKHNNHAIVETNVWRRMKGTVST